MRLLKIIATALVVLAGIVGGLEVMFRLAGRWLTAAAPVPVHDRVVVLCVGDSHTRGHLDPDNYPAALEHLLNERTNRVAYRVLNVGVAGLNTTNVRHRFERYVDYYQPAVVLHWAGINNFWNYSETNLPPPSFVGRLLEESRVVRFLRVALFYRRLHHQEFEEPRQEVLDLWTPNIRFRVNYGGVEEEIRGQPGDHRPFEQVEATTYADVEAMMTLAWGRDIPMYVITYPFAEGYYKHVNKALREVSAAFNIPVIDSGLAAARAAAESPGEELFDSWAHPLPRVYLQVAEEAYRTLVAQEHVSPAP